METTTKKCTKCGRELPIEQFSINNKHKDGRQSWCKDCMNAAARAPRAAKLGKFSDSALIDELRRRGKNVCSDLTPRSAMEFLAARGYKGKLEFVRTEIIDITNF